MTQTSNSTAPEPQALPVPLPVNPPPPLAPAPKACLDCGSPAPGRHCAECGQSTAPMHTSLMGLLHEFFEDFFHLDGKLVRTFGPLLTRPGFLSREYWAGRRTRYVGPFRVYLVASVLYFGVNALGLHASETKPTQAALQTDVAFEEDALVEEQDSEALKRFARLLGRQMHKLQSSPDGIEKLEHRFTSNFPKLGLLFLPCFGLLVALFFRRAGLGYPHHFVFGLHVHAFVCVAGLASDLSPWRLFDAVFVWSVPVYLFLALKRAYGFSTRATVFRFLGLGVTYGLLLLTAFTAFAFAIFFSL